MTEASDSVIPARAMILAAGLGLRMRPLTDDRPKPLVEVAGRTLLDHTLDRLAAAGVGDVVINLHYKGEMIRAHCARRSVPRLHFSDETSALLDTGGGLRKALPLLGEAPFFTLNSDSIWIEGLGSNLKRLARAFREEAMDGLLLLVSLVDAVGYHGKGDFEMDAEGRIARRAPSRLAPFVWSGVQILHPRLLEGAPEGPFSTNLLWDRAIGEGRLYGLRLQGTWMHVGTPEAVGEAEQAIARS